MFNAQFAKPLILICYYFIFGLSEDNFAVSHAFTTITSELMVDFSTLNLAGKIPKAFSMVTSSLKSVGKNPFFYHSSS